MELNDIQKEANNAGQKAIFFGLIALLFAVMLGWIFAQTTTSGPQTQPVVVASSPVASLVPLNTKDFRVVNWPVESIPEGSFGSLDSIFKDEWVSTIPVAVDQPILRQNLASPDKGLGVSHLIEPGMRPFIMEIPQSLSESQMINPGSLIDIIAIATKADKNGAKGDELYFARVVLQNVKVIAVGLRVDIYREQEETRKKVLYQPMGDAHIVTLLVSVDDFIHLSLLQQKSRLSIVLRGATDNELMKTTYATLDKNFNFSVRDPQKIIEDDVVSSTDNNNNKTKKSFGPAVRNHR